MSTGVVGATSKLGGLVVQALRERGHRVEALVRRPGAWGDGPARRCDLLRPETLDPAMEGLQVVVSVAGASLMPWPVSPRTTFEQTDRDGHARLAEAAAAAGVRRVVYVSVFGDADMEALAYVRAHRGAEEALMAHLPEVVVARPTGLFGAFDQLLPLARRGIGVDVRGGRARTNPLSEVDLARFLAEAADGVIGPGVNDLGGPDVWTRAEIWDLAFAACERRGIHVPSSSAGLRVAAAMVHPIDRRAADVLRFVAHILTHDSIAPRVGEHTLPAHWGTTA